MDAPQLTDDFREFLRLLNAHGVDDLLVGGYAVGLHGYPRPTIDLDVRIRPVPENAERVASSVRAFGFDLPEVTPALFINPRAVTFDVAGLAVPVIALADLKINKRAAGRHKDLADLDYLP